MLNRNGTKANLTSDDDNESLKSQDTCSTKCDNTGTPDSPATAPFVDYADAIESDLERLTQLNQNGTEAGSDRRPSSNVKMNDQFPMKLYRMLSVVEDLGLSHIVSWKVHGRAFQVKNVELFVSEVLPRFFRQSKITSFQRQLNLYGFQRFLHGKDVGASYHQFFLRGKPFLCQAMYRTKVKGLSKRAKRKASEYKGKEPNLYKIGKYLPPISPAVRAKMLKDFHAKETSKTSKLTSIEDLKKEDEHTTDKKRIREPSSERKEDEQAPPKQPRTWNQQVVPMPLPLHTYSHAPFQLNTESSFHTKNQSREFSNQRQVQDWHQLTTQGPTPHPATNGYPFQPSSFQLQNPCTAPIHTQQQQLQQQCQQQSIPQPDVIPLKFDLNDKELTSIGDNASFCELDFSDHDEVMSLCSGGDIIPTSLDELQLLDSQRRNSSYLSIDDDLKSFFLELMKSSEEGFVKLMASSNHDDHDYFGL